MKLREATDADMEAMLQLGRQMHAESPRYSLLKFDEQKVHLQLRAAMTGEAYYLMVAEHDNGEVVGGMIGYMNEAWFSQEQIASDLALFIQQDRRGGLAAVRLLRDFIAWARERDAKLVNIAVSTGVAPEAAAGIFKAAGAKFVGYIYEA